MSNDNVLVLNPEHGDISSFGRHHLENFQNTSFFDRMFPTVESKLQAQRRLARVRSYMDFEQKLIDLSIEVGLKTMKTRLHENLNIEINNSNLRQDKERARLMREREEYMRSELSMFIKNYTTAYKEAMSCEIESMRTKVLARLEKVEKIFFEKLDELDNNFMKALV